MDNLVSGNGVDGILVQGVDGGLIQGNLVGTNAGGTAAIPNQTGILLSGASNVTVGGTAAGPRNVLAGNQLIGVSLEDYGVGNTIQGNLFGTDVSGTGPLGNGTDGIRVTYDEEGSQSGRPLIGGPDPGAGNTIAFHGNHGVEIRNSTKANESDGSIDSNLIYSNAFDGILIAEATAFQPHYRVTRNAIHSNGWLGIDLGQLGVAPNDSRGHTGPNNYQNLPVITSAVFSNSATEVSGTLQGAPDLPYWLEFFANAESDPSNHGEGQTFLGSVMVVTDENGHAAFEHVALPAAPSGQTFLSATAMDGDGNTSEFSGSFPDGPAQTTTDLAIAMTASPAAVHRGENITFTITVSNLSPIVADNNILFMDLPTGTSFIAMTGPSGWTLQTPSEQSPEIMEASTPSISAGASAEFTVTVRVDLAATIGSTISGVAKIATETVDANNVNDTAQASVAVADTPPPAPAPGVTLEISGNVNPATVGQDITYTITLTNPTSLDATGTVAHVTLPGTLQIVSLGGGSQAPSGVDFPVGTLPGEATQTYQIIVRPESAGTVTLTLSATADEGVNLGDPASVTTPVIGATPAEPPPGDASPSGAPAPSGDPAPQVLRAVRYGFHHQPTLIVVTLGEGASPEAASKTSSYFVISTASRTRRVIPISRAFYNVQTRQATLRLAESVYLYRPWRFVVQAGVTAQNAGSIPWVDSVTQMDRRSLMGPAYRAPGAQEVGVTGARGKASTAPAPRSFSVPFRHHTFALRRNPRAR